MALSKSMTKDPLRYVVENVLAIDDVQTVLLALGQIGIADIYDLIFLGAESLVARSQSPRQSRQSEVGIPNQDLCLPIVYCPS